MSAPPSRPTPRTSRLSSPTAPEIIGMFMTHNPDIDPARIESVGELVAYFGARMAELSPTELRTLASEVLAVIDRVAAPRTPLELTPKGEPEASRGDGLGAIVSAADGRKRLAAYAKPLAMEAWAGPMAGPTELERDYGIARSTLHAWQKQGAVLGLLVGVRKHAFPIEQFVDGRPVAGLSRVLDTIGEPRTAWLWLREPNPGLAGATPLTRLKSGGDLARVIDVAWSNFAQR